MPTENATLDRKCKFRVLLFGIVRRYSPRSATGIDWRRAKIAMLCRRVHDDNIRQTIFTYGDFYENMRVCARSVSRPVQEMHLQLFVIHAHTYVLISRIHIRILLIYVHVHAHTHVRSCQICISDRLTRAAVHDACDIYFHQRPGAWVEYRWPCVYFTNAAGDVWNHTRSDNHSSMIARACTRRLHSFRFISPMCKPLDHLITH